MRVQQFTNLAVLKLNSDVFLPQIFPSDFYTSKAYTLLYSKDCIEVFRCSSGVKQDNSKRHGLKTLSTQDKRESTIVDEQPRTSGSSRSKILLPSLSRRSSVPVKAQHNATACRMVVPRHIRPQRHTKSDPVMDLCTQTSKLRMDISVPLQQ